VDSLAQSTGQAREQQEDTERFVLRRPGEVGALRCSSQLTLRSLRKIAVANEARSECTSLPSAGLDVRHIGRPMAKDAGPVARKHSTQEPGGVREDQKKRARRAPLLACSMLGAMVGTGAVDGTGGPGGGGVRSRDGSFVGFVSVPPVSCRSATRGVGVRTRTARVDDLTLPRGFPRRSQG
jgi:hypothetical protein